MLANPAGTIATLISRVCVSYFFGWSLASPNMAIKRLKICEGNILTNLRGVSKDREKIDQADSSPYSTEQLDIVGSTVVTVERGTKFMKSFIPTLDTNKALEH
jgi:hypothetical protein